MSETIQSVFINGRQWVDTRNGQTYHAAQIEINGRWVGNTGRAFGYGDQYLETALTWLKQHGIIAGDVRSLWHLSHEQGFALYTVRVDVLKRELFDFNVNPDAVARFAMVNA